MLLAEAGAHEGGLKRVLGALDLTALGIGAIIGAGIFVLTGVAAARYAGPAISLSFVVAGFSAAVAVGWSGYLDVILKGMGIHLPGALTHAPEAGALMQIDLPALLIVLLIS